MLQLAAELDALGGSGDLSLAEGTGTALVPEPAHLGPGGLTVGGEAYQMDAVSEEQAAILRGRLAKVRRRRGAAVLRPRAAKFARLPLLTVCTKQPRPSRCRLCRPGWPGG